MSRDLWREAQSALAEAGHYTGAIDGDPGSMTARAVLASQGVTRAAIQWPGPAGVAMIKRWEGCKLAAYQDSAGVWTIGWGSTGPDIRAGVRWTQAEADARFARDAASFGARVAALVGDAPTTQSQADALVSLAYNIGTGALGKSTLLARHKAGDHAGAAAEFGKWVNAGGERVAGLVNRRAAEAALYLRRAMA